MKSKDAERYTAGDWLPFFLKAEVIKKEIADAKSEHGKMVAVGKFLSPLVGREVPIRVNGRGGRVRLVAEEGRSNARHYYFTVVWDEPEPGPTDAGAADTPQPNAHAKSSKSKAAPQPLPPSKTGKATADTAAKNKTKDKSRTTAGAVNAKKHSAPAPPSNRPTPTARPHGNQEDW